jgi:hypothetical protein
LNACQHKKQKNLLGNSLAGKQKHRKKLIFEVGSVFVGRVKIRVGRVVFVRAHSGACQRASVVPVHIFAGKHVGCVIAIEAYFVRVREFRHQVRCGRIHKASILKSGEDDTQFGVGEIDVDVYVI